MTAPAKPIVNDYLRSNGKIFRPIKAVHVLILFVECTTNPGSIATVLGVHFLADEVGKSNEVHMVRDIQMLENG